MAVPAPGFWGVRGVHTRPNTGDMHEIVNFTTESEVTA